MANQNELMNRSHGNVETVQQRETLAPVVDVYENVDELLLLVDVPGAINDGIDVQLDKGQLTILAKRREENPGSLVASEYRASDYLRVFSLPPGVDAAKIDAQLSGGVLQLRLPKSETVKPRRIEVRQG